MWGPNPTPPPKKGFAGPKGFASCKRGRADGTRRISGRSGQTQTSALTSTQFMVPSVLFSGGSPKPLPFTPPSSINAVMYIKTER